MDFPEQLKPKDGDEEQEEDVLPVGLGQGSRQFLNLNQSIFGLIAAAGPKVDFHDRFEGHSSEEEAEDSDGHALREGSKDASTTDPMAQTTILLKSGAKSNKSHRRKLSDSKLMRSVPILSRLSTKSRQKKDVKKPVVQIQEESEPESPAWDGSSIPLANDENRLAPVMSRMLEARAEVSARPSFDLERQSIDKSNEPLDLAEVGPSELSKRLQKIFEFEEPEELISGWILPWPPYRLRNRPVLTLGTRIPVLAASRRAPARLHLHNIQTHLLLRIPSKESGQSNRIRSRKDIAHTLPA